MELRRNGWSKGSRLFAEHGGNRRRGTLARERTGAADHLVDHAAQAEDVRAGAERFRAKLLGRHVRRRPENDAGAGEPRLGRGLGRRPLGRTGQFGQAEVEDLGVAARGQHDVAGLDVAVNHALCMRGGERISHLLRDANRLGDRERATCQPFGQGLALDVLHGNEHRAVVLTDFVDSADVRVIESRCRLRLAQQSGVRRGVGAGRGRQHLDGHAAIERGILAEVDLAHAARAQRPQDPVSTNRFGSHLCASCGTVSWHHPANPMVQFDR